MTKFEAVRLLVGDDMSGIDFAVPQPWADHVRETTGTDPACFTVWDYRNSIFGEPYPLTCQACKVLGAHAEHDSNIY